MQKTDMNTGTKLDKTLDIFLLDCRWLVTAVLDDVVWTWFHNLQRGRGDSNKWCIDIIRIYKYWIVACLERLKKLRKFTEDSQTPGQDMHSVRPEYRSSVARTRSHRVNTFVFIHRETISWKLSNIIAVPPDFYSEYCWNEVLVLLQLHYGLWPFGSYQFVSSTFLCFRTVKWLTWYSPGGRGRSLLVPPHDVISCVGRAMRQSIHFLIN